MPEYQPRARNLAGLDDFTRAYLECAEWCGLQEEEQEELELSVAPKWSARSIEQAKEDCAAFFAEHESDIGTEHSRAGMDFYLTRNRHGAGFWDGGRWPADAGRRMTEDAHAYGSADVTFDAETEELHHA